MLTVLAVALLGAAPPGNDDPQRAAAAALAEAAKLKDIKRPPPRTWDGGTEEAKNADLSRMVAWLSTSDGGFPFAKYRWTVPDQVGIIDVPVVQVVNGLPVRFSAAVSTAKPDFLLKYYADEFEKAGLYIPPADSQFELGPPVIQMTALDTDNLISYTVILQVSDPKRTTVVMGQGYLTPWLQRNKGAPEIAPVLPAASNVVSTHAEGLDVLQYTVNAEVTAVEAFYKETLSKSGYTVGADKELRAMIFTKGTERISVKAVKAPGKNEVGVLIQRRLAARGVQ